MIYEDGSHIGIILVRKPKSSHKIVTHCHYEITNPTFNDSGQRGDRPVAIHLTRDKALSSRLEIRKVEAKAVLNIT
jgi:hypothetical protein